MSTSSTTRWVVDAQAAIQHGAVSGGASPEEPAAQGKGTEVATERAGEDESTPSEVVGLGANEAEASTTAGAIGDEARAPKASEARAMDAATEVEMAEARAPGPVEAKAVGTEAGRASAPPLVQTISSEDSSWGKEAVDAEAVSTAERPVLTPAEGSSVLVRV